MELEEKAASESSLTMPQMVMPFHANAAGRMHGGEVMKLMDSAAYVVATRHCRQNVVTASVTQLSFLEPVFVGDLLICSARIIYTGSTSMEVHVIVQAEHLESGVVEKVSEGYFFMVALDRNGRPTGIPPLKLETDEDRQHFEEARQRMAKIKGSIS